MWLRVCGYKCELVLLFVLGMRRYILAWSVLLIRPRVSGDELNYKQLTQIKLYKQTRDHIRTPSLRLKMKSLFVAVVNTYFVYDDSLVFFHLTPPGNDGQFQFADSIISETICSQRRRNAFLFD